MEVSKCKGQTLQNFTTTTTKLNLKLNQKVLKNERRKYEATVYLASQLLYIKIMRRKKYVKNTVSGHKIGMTQMQLHFRRLEYIHVYAITPEFENSSKRLELKYFDKRSVRKQALIILS